MHNSVAGPLVHCAEVDGGALCCHYAVGVFVDAERAALDGPGYHLISQMSGVHTPLQHVVCEDL